MQGYAGSMLRVKIVSQIIVWVVPICRSVNLAMHEYGFWFLNEKMGTKLPYKGMLMANKSLCNGEN
jgi:hypothetical protein